MATAATSETYDNAVIKEDLMEDYSMISPEECPFQMLAGVGEGATDVRKDWSTVELAALETDNRVPEGDDAPGINAPTLASRLYNWTQISDKVVEISHSHQAVDAAANNIQRLASQITLKMKEMKRDKEHLFTQNVIGNAGAAAEATTRQAAGFPTWIITNTASDLSAGTATPGNLNSGHPSAAWTFGTPTEATFTEASLEDVIELCWNEGAEPSVIMLHGGNKRTLSKTFVGNATRYKNTDDKAVVSSIDFYDSDFGELTVVPNRFMAPLDDTGVAPSSGSATNFPVYVMDPDYVEMSYLDEVQQKPLAETGHAIKHLVWCEATLLVSNPKAHGIIVGTDNVAASS